MSVQSDRIERLKKYITDNNQAILITNDTNVFYYSGLYKSEGAFFVTKEKAYLLVDFRYYEAALNCAKDCDVVCFKLLTNSVVELAKKHNINSLVLETENITLSLYSRYLKTFSENSITLDTSGGLDTIIRNQRMIKSKCELDFIAEAQLITEKSYVEVLNYLKPDVTEKEISDTLGYYIKKNGGEDVSFDLITVTGKKTSLPHGVPGNEKIQEGDFFIFDIGAIYKGYHSDMTRTVAVKSCSEEMEQIYDTVLQAHNKALNMVNSGVKACDVDKSARQLITDAGFGDCFGHSTGHGVGLDIHEAPNVSASGEIILSENMVITIEPGIYLENKFGVRIEDIVCVTKDSYKSFANIPKQLIVV